MAAVELLQVPSPIQAGWLGANLASSRLAQPKPGSLPTSFNLRVGEVSQVIHCGVAQGIVKGWDSKLLQTVSNQHWRNQFLQWNRWNWKQKESEPSELDSRGIH